MSSRMVLATCAGFSAATAWTKAATGSGPGACANSRQVRNRGGLQFGGEMRGCAANGRRRQGRGGLYEGRDRFGSRAGHPAFAHRGCVERRVDKWRGFQFGGEAGQAQQYAAGASGADAVPMRLLVPARCGHPAVTCRRRVRRIGQRKFGGQFGGTKHRGRSQGCGSLYEGGDGFGPRCGHPAVARRRRACSAWSSPSPAARRGSRSIGTGARAAEDSYEGGDGLRLRRRHPFAARGRRVRRRIHRPAQAPVRRRIGERAGYMRESLRRRLVRRRRRVRPAARASNARSAADIRLARIPAAGTSARRWLPLYRW